MKTQVILPTAGTGTRLDANLPKPLVELCGKPLFVHALEAFQDSPVIDSVIFVGNGDKLHAFKTAIEQYRLTKVKKIVAGGETRRKSVFCGLTELDADTDTVMIHDGVRPFVSLRTLEEIVDLCEEWEAVVTAVPVKSTIKRVNKNYLFVQETLNREELWETQTPQAFKKDVLLKAHMQNLDINPTDDAAMVESLGVQVKIHSGDYKNIKVTTWEDLVIAEAFLKSQRQARTAGLK